MTFETHTLTGLFCKGLGGLLVERTNRSSDAEKYAQYPPVMGP